MTRITLPGRIAAAPAQNPTMHPVTSILAEQLTMAGPSVVVLLVLFLLMAVAVGMLLLVVWRVVEAGFGHRHAGDDRSRKRLVSAGKAVVYGVIGFSAVKVAVECVSGSNRCANPRTSIDGPRPTCGRGGPSPNPPDRTAACRPHRTVRR